MVRKQKARPRPRAGPASTLAAALDDHAVPAIRQVAIRSADKKLIRAPTAEKASWRDPDDQNAQARAPRLVHGWRTSSAIGRMASRGGEVSPDHMRAADRYSRDVEHSGAYRAHVVDGTAAGQGGGANASYNHEAATYQARVRSARQALGFAACSIVDAVVLNNSTIKAYAAARRVNEKVAMGRLVAGLTRLVEHYGASELEATFEDT